MSDIGIDQVLAQMRVMAAAAGSRVESGEGATPSGEDFGAFMKASIQQVNEAQNQARELADAFEAGSPDVGLPEVMVALQKASVSFQAVTQVRNKLLNAYQEIMNMQV
ncbi:MAG: flagellar hook-basal body complex protein FliE [Porticoccaceae bacterium]